MVGSSNDFNDDDANDDFYLTYRDYPIQPYCNRNNLLQLCLFWFRENQFGLVVAAFCVAVSGPLFRWIRNIPYTVPIIYMTMDGRQPRQRIDVVLRLYVLEIAERLWGFILDVIRIISQLLERVLERRRYYYPARPAARELPDLVSDDEDEELAIGRRVEETTNHGTAATTASAAAEPRVQQQQSASDVIEPAFLSESDYPEDWLVYHPVLRVVPKAEADRYDRGESLESPTTNSGSDMEEKKEEPNENAEGSDTLESPSSAEDGESQDDNANHLENGHDRLTECRPSSPSSPRKSSQDAFPVQHSVAAN